MTSSQLKHMNLKMTFVTGLVEIIPTDIIFWTLWGSIWTKLDASLKQRLEEKEIYTTEEEVYAAIDKAMLELDPLHLCRMEGIEMTSNNGYHCS